MPRLYKYDVMPTMTGYTRLKKSAFIRFIRVICVPYFRNYF